MGTVLAAALFFAAAALVAAEAPLTVPPPESAPAPSGDDRAAHEAEIARLLRLIFDERRDLAGMRREHQARIDELTNTEFALERSIAAWQTEIAATQTQWSAARDERAAIETELAARRAATERWRGLLGAYPPILTAQISAGIDFDRAHRLEAAAQLAQAAQDPTVAPADLWQRLSRLQDSEEGLARTLEPATVWLAPDRAAEGLRAGLAMLTAPAPEGGALAIGPGARPQAETPVPAADATGLTAALQVLSRRRSPEFTALFWPALPAPAAAAPLPPAPRIVPAPPALPPGANIGAVNLPLAVPPMVLPVDAPGVTPVRDDPQAKLEAALLQARAAKAAFQQAAAKEYASHFGRVGQLETIETERGRLQRALQSAVATEQDASAHARDSLLLENERQTLLHQALLATRDQLAERLNGSLEAAAQPAIAAQLAALKDPGSTGTPDHKQFDRDLAIDQLMSGELQIFTALLTAARSAAIFDLPVRLEDGHVIQARALQPSLLSGYFADPTSRTAGLLITDPREPGVWRGQVKGLVRADQANIAARILDGQAAGLLPVDVTGGAAAIQATHQWNLLEWFDAGGKVMWPLLIVALAGLVLVIERAAALLRLQGRTRDLLARVETALAAGQYDTAQQLCDPTRGPVQRVLHAALSHRQESRAAIEDAIQVTALGELPHLQKGLGMLALLAGLAPLLGLLGTVTGMINTFQMVNLFGSSDTRFLAGGISEALITTEFGLVIAIPLVFAHGILGRLSERILAAIELGAAIVVQRLGNLPSASGRQPAVAPHSAPEPAAAGVIATPAKPSDTVLVVADRAPGGGA